MRVEQPGPETFLELYDTPNSYMGFGSDLVSVKVTENGLEFTTATPAGTSVNTYDISSQFDGITTIFTLPVFKNILMFTITGWPPNGTLRPTTDFTTPTNTTVTLTAQVSAPAAGTTGIILYAT